LVFLTIRSRSKLDKLIKNVLIRMSNKGSIIVCLPVFNEELSIGKMIADIKSLEYPLIVSDGGSSDQSIPIAKSLNIPILYRKGKGKGYGMLQAMEYAYEKGLDTIVFIDCDLSYPIDIIPDLVTLLHHENLDMVVGNRDRNIMSLKSKFLNWLLAGFVNFLFNGRLKDPASGFRALRINSFYGQLKETGMDLEIELSGFALRKNLKIKEIDVSYFTRVGESKLQLKDIIQALFTIFRVRFRKYP
jgi:glycosyltransferase involved in cell wall biosynthesis